MRWTPNSGASVISTSAIRLLVVGSDPGNSMPAALRTRLRPPSQPTRYVRPQRPAIAEADIDAGIVLHEARHLDAAIDRHLELLHPAGEDPLDVVLPQPEPVGVAGGKVADVEMRSGEPARPAPSAPRRRTGRRSRADREPRWCAHADHLRASRQGSWLGRRSTMATSTPASASSPASISPVGPPPTITTACSVMASGISSLRRTVASGRVLRDDRGLEASPLRATYKLEGGPRARHQPLDRSHGASPRSGERATSPDRERSHLPARRILGVTFGN